MDGLNDLRGGWLERIAEAADEAALEELRVAALGKKGEISLKMRELGRMTPEERQVAGPALNALKDEVNSALAAKKAALGDAALEERLRGEWLDVTLPGRHRRAGTIHPVSQVMEEVTAIFADMGFAVAEGPQIETDWYNFDALNIPGHHPARAEMDTFYTHRREGDNRPPHVLRTHTSPVQIRHMEAHGAPVRVIAPGRVYRADYDADPFADVPSGRGSGDRPRHLHGEPEMGAGGVLHRLFRHIRQNPLPRVAFPLHRTLGGGGYPVFMGRRHREGGRRR